MLNTDKSCTSCTHSKVCKYRENHEALLSLVEGSFQVPTSVTCALYLGALPNLALEGFDKVNIPDVPEVAQTAPVEDPAAPTMYCPGSVTQAINDAMYGLFHSYRRPLSITMSLETLKMLDAEMTQVISSTGYHVTTIFGDVPIVISDLPLGVLHVAHHA